MATAAGITIISFLVLFIFFAIGKELARHESMLKDVNTSIANIIKILELRDEHKSDVSS